MGYSDEEIQKFVEENRDIIEVLMARRDARDEADADDIKEKAGAKRSRIQEDMGRVRDRADDTRYRLEEDIEWARYRVDQNRERMEGAFRETYEAFTDPEVQKHFMTMGLNFIMGMSAFMRKMPGPDFVKEAASDMETSWKKASCSSNTECSARKRKIDIEEDEKPEGIVPITFEEDA